MCHLHSISQPPGEPHAMALRTQAAGVWFLKGEKEELSFVVAFLGGLLGK